MPNSLLTIDMITRKAAEVLENSLVFTRNINRQYDDSFAQTGAKIGSTLRLRLPDRVLVTDGAALQAQDDVEQWTTLPITSQKHVGINFTSAELALSLDDFADRVLKPRISQLAASVDADVYNTCFRRTFNSVGTPGTTPATSLVLLQAQQALNETAAPMMNRYATVNPAANAALVEGLKGLFNPVDVVTRQFKSGLMGEGVLGYDEISMSQSVRNFTTGTRSGAHTVTTTVSTQGQSTINITGTGTQVIQAGDVFTIAGVNAVNPQTRESTGTLQRFVVLATNTASGGAYTAVSVSPAIYTASEALATVDAFPQASAVVTFFGGASLSYPQNLVYHKDAYAMVSADLVLPNGVEMASRVVHNGISMRIVKQYDVNNDMMPCRVDVLYGSAAIRPELGVRLWG
jgi:hypothetical protein